MLTVFGSQADTPQPQSGVFGGQTQLVTAQGSVDVWHTMPDAHSASTVQWAGVQPSTVMVAHGSGSGHDDPGAHGAADAQPDSPTTVHSKPTPQAGPAPQPSGGAISALETELNRKTAEAANVAGMKRS
jgi:hypothetical protein